jgi:hypothetical protein
VTDLGNKVVYEGKLQLSVGLESRDTLELLWIQIQGLKDSNWECPILVKAYEGYSDIMLQGVKLD